MKSIFIVLKEISQFSGFILAIIGLSVRTQRHLISHNKLSCRRQAFRLPPFLRPAVLKEGGYMTKWRKWDRIKYQAQLDPAFANQIASIPGGDKIFSCIQCGTCSATHALPGQMPLIVQVYDINKQLVKEIRRNG
jgi:hypothetical protein